MKSCAIYIRVSTDMQTELSPDAQKRLALDYAKKNDFVVTEIYQDDGISGRKAERRPSFQRMVSDAKSGLFQYILVWKFSRFARNMEESIVYKKMLSRSGVEVISISEPLPEGPIGTLVERIFEWMDEYYSINLGQETRRGHFERARRGYVSGLPPYGYSIVDKNYAPNDQASVVQKIFESFASGMTYRAIVMDLNSHGIISSKGTTWSVSGLKYILKNRVYLGEYYFGQNSLKHDVNESDIVVFKDHHPAIISPELFDAVQTRRARLSNGQIIERVSVSHFLCGVLVCPICGKPLSRRGEGKTYASRWRCGRYNEGKHEGSFSVSDAKINDAFFEALEKLCADNSSKYTKPSKKPIFNTAVIDRLEKQLERCKNAYIMGVDTIDEYKENKARIMAAIQKAKSETTEERETINISSLLELLKSNESIEKKHAAVMSVIDKCYFSHDKSEFFVIINGPC